MPCTHYLPVGIKSYGLLCFVVLSEDSSDVSSTAACAGKWCCLICSRGGVLFGCALTLPASHAPCRSTFGLGRSEEHTSELQSRLHLVCRLLLDKKNNYTPRTAYNKTLRRTRYRVPPPHG